MIKDNTEVIKGPEKVDDFLLSLFKALDRQKAKDDRKSVEKKVVVRRLPPTMTEERFLNEVSPLPEFNYMYFIPGDPHAAPFHHSRVYINFLKEDDMYMFTDKFDNYVFVDDTGDEYPAIVELAPYQRIPKKKLDKDPNWGKIHENPVFLEFKRKFEQKTIDTTLKTTQHFFESVEDKSQEQDSSTPLLEYLAKQNDRQRVRENLRDERRKKVFIRKQEKEEIRRNKKGEKEIFIKPKQITKISSTSKRVVEEKSMKDTSQKKIIKSHRDDSDFIDEKKKLYSEENYKIKSEEKSKVDDAKKMEFKLKSMKLSNPIKFFDDDLKDEVFQKSKKYYAEQSKEDYEIKSEEKSKVDDVKKIEFKLKSMKLSNPIKFFDNDLKDEVFQKPKKYYAEQSKEDYEIKKKYESSKSGYVENKSSGPSKQIKPREETNSNEINETEKHKKYRSDSDKKYIYSKRTESRRQDSKTDRRIRNKDRPAIEIYRPGMGRLNKLKEDGDCIE